MVEWSEKPPEVRTTLRASSLNPDLVTGSLVSGFSLRLPTIYVGENKGEYNNGH